MKSNVVSDPINWSTFTISMFKDEFFFLSNFYPCIIIMELNINDKLKPLRFYNAESAYQFGKAYFARDEIKMNEIQDSEKPSEAKRLGQEIKLRNPAYWENYKLKWMYKVLESKFFQHSELQMKLLHTFPKILIESNYWNDGYWGFDIKKKIGFNNLGLLLMLLRSRLLSGHTSNIINYSVNI